MKKTVTKTVRQTVEVCDVCRETELTYSLRWRFACGRYGCFKCLSFTFTPKTGDLVEMGVNVCKDCRKHEELVGQVQAVLDQANLDLRKRVDVWKKAAKSGA